MKLSSGLADSHSAHKAVTARCGTVPSTLPILWRAHDRALHHNFFTAYHQKRLEKTFPTVPSSRLESVCSGSDSGLRALILHQGAMAVAASYLLVLWRAHDRALYHNFPTAYHQKRLEKAFPTVPSSRLESVCSGSGSGLNPVFLHQGLMAVAASCCPSVCITQ